MKWTALGARPQRQRAKGFDHVIGARMKLAAPGARFVQGHPPAKSGVVADIYGYEKLKDFFCVADRRQRSERR